FNDIQIKTTQLLHTEIVHFLVDVMEAILFVGLRYFILQTCRRINHPTIELDHLLSRHAVCGWIKTVQIRQQEARSITDTAVRISATLQNSVRYSHFARVIRR